MTCDCKETLTGKLLERSKEQLPDSKDHSVEMTGYAIVFGENEAGQSTLETCGFMPVEIKHTVTVKKTGLDRVKKEKTSLLFTYCPFCGVPYKEKKEVAES